MSETAADYDSFPSTASDANHGIWQATGLFAAIAFIVVSIARGASPS